MPRTSRAARAGRERPRCSGVSTRTNSAITRNRVPNSSPLRSNASYSGFSGSSRICSCRRSLVRFVARPVPRIALDRVAQRFVMLAEVLDQHQPGPCRDPVTPARNTHRLPSGIAGSIERPTTWTTNMPSSIRSPAGARTQPSCSLSIPSPNPSWPPRADGVQRQMAYEWLALPRPRARRKAGPPRTGALPE